MTLPGTTDRPHIDPPNPPFLLIKALENNVSITVLELSEGVRGTAMPERLNAGEVFVLFLDGRVQGYKIKGNAEIYSPYGTIPGERAHLERRS